MPPPRLPRHLRPCRPLWSARQVRFASDRPSSRPFDRPSDKATAGDDAAGEGSSQADLSLGSSPGSRASPPSADGTQPSQAQRMRKLVGGESARSAPRPWKIHRHLTAGGRDKGPSAIATHVRKREKLAKEQQPDTSTQREAELRERLRTLEEQLALLQTKLGGTRQPSLEPEPATTSITSSPPAAPSIESSPPAATAIQSEKPATTSTTSPSITSPRAPTASHQASEQSLLDELFPEASSLVPPVAADRRPAPPKLDLPAPATNPRIRLTPSDTRTDREKAIDAFRARGEHTTVLQLSHCSTALAESDFRRLIPRGLHMDTWSRDGHFYNIIPGRDPLSLARLPFYYLLFHTPASALAYQKNAARLSRLAALHAPASIASPLAPPAGFLEDGDDIAAVASSFVLHPAGHPLHLRAVMQPYNRALRALIDAGGYAPIVPNVDGNGRRVHRVLLHIDGYEPSHWDLWQIISRHAHARGIIWPFRNDHAAALRRLRDVINLRTVGRQKLQATAANPRAAASFTGQPTARTAAPLTGQPTAARTAARTAAPLGTDASDAAVEYEDPTIASFLGPTSAAGANADGPSAKETNQLVMNRVYNRWIVELDDEDAARRFAALWHRVLLPDAKDRTGAWKEAEEERWVEAEYLW